MAQSFVRITIGRPIRSSTRSGRWVGSRSQLSVIELPTGSGLMTSVAQPLRSPDTSVSISSFGTTFVNSTVQCNRYGNGDTMANVRTDPVATRSGLSSTSWSHDHHRSKRSTSVISCHKRSGDRSKTSSPSWCTEYGDATRTRYRGSER